MSFQKKVIVIPDRDLWNISYSLLSDENGDRLLHKHVLSLALSISSLKTDAKSDNFRNESSLALIRNESSLALRMSPIKTKIIFLQIFQWQNKNQTTLRI